jgi:hypothetical protein
MKAQLRTAPATRTRKEWSPTKAFLPLILGKELDDELNEAELSKLELFEKGLANELSTDDTIEMAVGKIVKMALAAEFGAALVAAKGARSMVDNITQTVLAEPSLRKQALIIIDRFAHV